MQSTSCLDLSRYILIIYSAAALKLQLIQISLIAFARLIHDLFNSLACKCLCRFAGLTLVVMIGQHLKNWVQRLNLVLVIFSWKIAEAEGFCQA